MQQYQLTMLPSLHGSEPIRHAETEHAVVHPLPLAVRISPSSFEMERQFLGKVILNTGSRLHIEVGANVMAQKARRNGLFVGDYGISFPLRAALARR